MRQHSIGRQLWLVGAFALTMAGCFSEKPFGETTIGGNSGGSPTTPPPTTTPPPPNVKHAPTISGSPITAIRVGEAYAFQPSASDPDGDALTFTIQNRPGWASFNQATGRLEGTPASGDVGEFTSVRITVSDGRGAQASLPVFGIDVSQIALGSVTLSWSPPTTNADGSTITDLAGYRIYYGRSAGALDEMIVIDSTAATRWVVDNLSTTTWYFSMSSYNTSGLESARSSVVSRTLT
jgi:hypothetical protein